MKLKFEITNTIFFIQKINGWLQSLAIQHPGIVTYIQAGSSYEGRPIIGVKVSFSPNNEKNGVFLEGGIHAREWYDLDLINYDKELNFTF